jgi:hypothetical protein
MFSPDVMTRLLACQLDGTRTRKQLADALGRWARDGIVQLSAPKGSNQASLRGPAMHAAAIDQVLATLRHQALLVA